MTSQSTPAADPGTVNLAGTARHPVDPTVGPPAAPVNLRHERRRRGKSLRGMAEEIGVTKRVLEHAEAGRTPNASNQLAIARAYGLDVIVQWPDPDEVAA